VTGYESRWVVHDRELRADAFLLVRLCGDSINPLMMTALVQVDASIFAVVCVTARCGSTPLFCLSMHCGECGSLLLGSACMVLADASLRAFSLFIGSTYLMQLSYLSLS